MRGVRPCSALTLATALGGGVAFAADPVPLGPTIHVNAGLPAVGYPSVSYPDVARGADGGFVVVWQNQDDDGTDVFGRTFDAAGTPTSTNVEISAAVEEAKDYYPFVDSDAAGNFVVVWTASAYSSPSYRAMARQVNATGTPAGAAFQVGTPLINYIFSSNVAVADGGEFVVTWDNRYYDATIFAQRFDAAPARKSRWRPIRTMSSAIRPSARTPMATSSWCGPTWAYLADTLRW